MAPKKKGKEKPLKELRTIQPSARIDRELDRPVQQLDVPIEPKMYKRPDAWYWMGDGGHIYVTYGPRRKIPVIPPPDNRPRSSWLRLNEMMTLRWIKTGFEYLAFIPTFIPCFTTSMLCRFALEPHFMPLKINQVNDHLTVYMLADPWPGHWGEFEDILMRIVSILMKKANIERVRMPPRPRCRDLGKPFISREKCIEAVLEARTKLHPWFGLLAYLAALLDGIATFRTQSGETEKWPLWKGTLMTKGVPPSTADLLDWCVLASHEPQYQRLGAIVDFHSDPNMFYTRIMADCNVPVIYRLQLNQLDNVPYQHREAEFLLSYRKLINPRGTVQDMKIWLHKRIPPICYAPSSFDQIPLDGASCALGSDNAVFPLDNEPRAVPPLDPSSRQLEKETREEFFVRVDAEDKEVMTRETESSRKARLAREKEMEKYNSPGFNNTKTKVFVWNRYGEHEFRQRVDLHLADDIWSTFPKSNMRHNALRNEWDLWSDRPRLGYRPGPENIEDDDEDNYDNFFDKDGDGEIDPSKFVADTMSSIGKHTSRVGNNHNTEAARERAAVFRLCEMVLDWFGCNVTGQLPDLPPKVLVKYEKLSSHPDRLQRMFLDSISEVTASDLTRLAYIAAFYSSKHEIPPESLSDLHGVAISDFGNPFISVKSAACSARLINDTASPYVSLYSVELVDNSGCVVPDRYCRCLFVWRASTALTIKRLTGAPSRTLGHIAEFLLQVGSGFIIAVPKHLFQNPVDDPRVPPLGRRWRSYKPDSADFAVYRARCADLLSITRLRRALRCGGILWRIATDFLDISQGIDGPMSGTLNEPMHIKSLSNGEVDFVEDGLSIEEVRILIGAFESRDAKGKHEPVYYSFWPPPWVWDTSGYNIGYWAPDCEDWYVNRMEEYVNGTGKHCLLNVAQWDTSLTRFGDTTKMVETLEVHSSRVIAGNVLY